MGALDLALARAIYSIKHDLVKPEITDEHIVEFEDGRNLQVEDIIKAKGKEYCPVSLALKDGVTLITGANMGGKTISLKLARPDTYPCSIWFLCSGTPCTHRTF